MSYAEFDGHDWAEIGILDQAEPLAYVCQRCGERRPRGLVIAPTAISEQDRAKLQQRGYHVADSPFVPAGTTFIIDGRIAPPLDGNMFCPGAP